MTEQELAEFKELGERCAKLASEIDQVRADHQSEFDAAAKEVGSLTKRLELLQAQHRGYDDLRDKIAKNLKDSGMRRMAVLVVQLEKAELNLKIAEHERDKALAEVDRCREISERDGADYARLNEQKKDLEAEVERLKGPFTCAHDPANRGGACAACHAEYIEALEEATTELEDLMEAQENCGDPGAECPMQDSHKPGSTKDIAGKGRELLSKGGETKEGKHGEATSNPGH